METGGKAVSEDFLVIRFILVVSRLRVLAAIRPGGAHVAVQGQGKATGTDEFGGFEGVLPILGPPSRINVRWQSQSRGRHGHCSNLVKEGRFDDR